MVRPPAEVLDSASLGEVNTTFLREAGLPRQGGLQLHFSALEIPIVIAANAFRVAGTGFLAHFIGAEAAQGFYHSFAGWIVFAVAFVLLLGAGTLLGRLPDGAAARVAPVEARS